MWFPVTFIVRWFGWSSLFLLFAWALDQMFSFDWTLVVISGQNQTATFQIDPTAMMVALLIAIVVTIFSFGDDLKQMSKSSEAT